MKPPHLLPAQKLGWSLFSAQVRIIMSQTDGFSKQRKKVIYITQPELKWVCSEPPLHRKYWGHAGLKEQSCSAEESEVQIH